MDYQEKTQAKLAACRAIDRERELHEDAKAKRMASGRWQLDPAKLDAALFDQALDIVPMSSRWTSDFPPAPMRKGERLKTAQRIYGPNLTISIAATAFPDIQVELEDRIQRQADLIIMAVNMHSRLLDDLVECHRQITKHSGAPYFTKDFEARLRQTIRAAGGEP